MVFRNSIARFEGACALSVVVLASLALAGCGKKDADRPAGQVIGHVGQDTITIQELENEFRLAQVPADKRDDALTKRMLNEIVIRKALARQAVNAKLDREPTIQLDILRDKERMLQNALIQRKLSGEVAGIGQSDVDQFITTHSSQFAKRVIFITDQLELPAAELSPALGEATKGAKTLDEVQQQLTAMKLKSRREAGALDSAVMPSALFEQLQSQSAGNVFFTRTAAAGVYFKVVESKPQPLGGKEATNLARELIAREKLNALSKQGAEDAEHSATFEGDYAKIMEAGPAKDASPAKDAAPAKESAPAK